MIFDLQKASAWKRISAGLFDEIILGIAVVGLAFVFSVLFKYDDYNFLIWTYKKCFTQVQEIKACR